MATETDVVRTVFQTEWLGGSVVANMIRQYGLAERAISQFQKARGGGGAQQAAGGLAKLSSQTQIATGYMRDLGRQVAAGEKSFAMATLEASRFESGVSGAADASAGLLSKLSPLALGIGAVAVAVGGAVIAFQKLYPVLERGSEIAQLNQSFETLNASMNVTPGLLDDMREASQHTVSAFAAQEGFMTLVAGSSQEMTQALADAAPKLLEISKAANKLNPNLGDTNFLFTSLAKGVKRAEPRLIDNLGLKLRVSDANRELAKQLGKSVQELTAEEKQLAILNETLRAGDLLIKQVGGSAAGLGDSFQRVSAANEDFSNSVKENLFLALNISPALDKFSASLRDVAEANERFSEAKRLRDGGFATEAEAYQLGIYAQNRQIALYEELINSIYARKKAVDSANASDQIMIDNWRQLQGFQDIPGVAGTGESGPGFTVTGGTPGKNAALAGLSTEEVARTKLMNAIAESAKVRHEATMQAKADFEAHSAAAQKWADDVNDANQKAQEAWAAYNAVLGDIAVAHMNADQENSFFTRSIKDIGDAWVTTGGATEEQKELIDDLQGAYDKAEKNVRDLRLGIKGFGQDGEKTGEQIEKGLAAMEHYQQKLGEIKVAEEQTSKVHRDAIWNWDNLRKGLAAAADEAGVGAIDYLKLQLALGALTDEQAEAVLRATAVEDQMKKIGQDIKLGKIDPSEAEAALRDFVGRVSTMDISLILHPEVVQEDKSIEDLVLNEYGAEAGRIGGIPIGVNADTTPAHDTLANELFAEGAVPPLDVKANVILDDANLQVEAFRTEQGSKPILVPLETYWPGGGPPSAATPGGFQENAGGGNLMAGHMALVGEQGPELIVAGSNSTVIPNNQLGGGGGVNITINIDGGGNSEELAMVVEDQLLQAMQQIGLF